MNLFELMAVIAISTLLTIAGLGAASHSPQTIDHAAIVSLNAFFEDARTTAATSASGVTIELAPSTTSPGQTVLRMVAGRPIPSSTEGPLITTALIPTTVTLAGVQTAGIFVAPSGRIAVAPSWLPWTTFLASPTTCASTLSVSVGSDNHPATLSCSTGAIEDL